MERNQIDYYLHNILRKQLQKLRVNGYGLYSILDDVNIKLHSLIKRWKDKEYINALFVTVIEESNFYEPKVGNNIASLVVLCIRNSLLETICSIDYKSYGLKSAISSKDIIDITRSAINYFKDIDLDTLSDTIECNDFYHDLTNEYKVAYKALLELSKCNEYNTEREYKSVKDRPYIFEELNKVTNESKVINYESGISSSFNDSLIYILNGIKNKEATYFYIDSFKYLSRNFEKILKVLEFILTHDALFITNNFYISNNYVSRRKNLVRSSHKEDFNMEALNTITDITIKYREELTNLFSSAMNE
ncbi:MAG: hypothetical protein IJD92_01455 [Bacilli bacterium]|nr:hypothetical protein [Bacilli bacterium]